LDWFIEYSRKDGYDVQHPIVYALVQYSALTKQSLSEYSSSTSSPHGEEGRERLYSNIERGTTQIETLHVETHCKQQPT